jgi:hypothetical protein
MAHTPVQTIPLSETAQAAKTTAYKTTPYDIDSIKEEARSLVKRGVIDRHQPLYALCRYIPGRDWVCVELELERNDYLLRDRIIDLLGREDWEND